VRRAKTGGELIQALGDPVTSFTVTFDRNYDMADNEIIPLAQVDDSNVIDTVGDGARKTERTWEGNIQAQDTLEKTAREVPAPGPSLGSASSVSRRSTLDPLSIMMPTNI